MTVTLGYGLFYMYKKIEVLKHANEKIIAISEFAKIAQTSRRTLIFYDQKDIFKLAKIAENCYRYYSYG